MINAMPRPSRLKLPPLDLGKETFGQRLARLRKERGYTQIELADQIGIVQALVSDYEVGKLRLNAEMVVRFAKALGISTDELLGLEKNQPNSSVQNRRVLRRLHQVDQLSKRDQDALLRTIDAFVARAS